MNTLLSVLLIFGLGITEITLILLVLFVPYFIPSIIARNKVNFNGILLLNIFLGWTLLGWVGALIWALTDKTKGELYLSAGSNLPGSETKYRCRHCGFEHVEKTTFCQVCLKDEQGLTVEDYRRKAAAND